MQILKSVSKLINRVPGKKYLGAFRFLPLFFAGGAALEFTMIHWKVGEVNFYTTYKKREAQNLIQEILRELEK